MSTWASHLVMKNKTNVHAIPNKARDKIQEAMDELVRIMPQQAELAKMMQEGFVEAGFDEDEALKLTAYAIFK